MNSHKTDKNIRKCVVSGEHYPKTCMVRIVSFRGEDIAIDLRGKAPGRGCYIFPTEENYHKLIASNASQISRALKKKISANELQYLRDNLLEAFEEKKFRQNATKPVSFRLKKDQYEKIVKGQKPDNHSS